MQTMSFSQFIFFIFSINYNVIGMNYSFIYEDNIEQNKACKLALFSFINSNEVDISIKNLANIELLFNMAIYKIV